MPIENMTATPLEFWSLVASIVSVILALVAIGLSFGFFWLSLRSSNRIGETTGRLEEVVGILNRDTFSTLKDTYSEVLKHSWTGAQPSADDLSKEINSRADEKFIALRHELDERLEPLLTQQKRTASEVAQVRGFVDNALEQSRRILDQARDETLRHRIAGALEELFREGWRTMRAGDLHSTMMVSLGPIDWSEFGRELLVLRHEGKVKFDISIVDISRSRVPPETELHRPDR